MCFVVWFYGCCLADLIVIDKTTSSGHPSTSTSANGGGSGGCSCRGSGCGGSGSRPTRGVVTPWRVAATPRPPCPCPCTPPTHKNATAHQGGVSTGPSFSALFRVYSRPSLLSRTEGGNIGPPFRGGNAGGGDVDPPVPPRLLSLPQAACVDLLARNARGS